MLFPPRIRLKPLSALCRRLATATGAGLDDRRIWRDEAERGSSSERFAAAAIRDELSRGSSVADAFRSTRAFYPPLFEQIVAVGDKAGRLDRTYRRLAEHYEQLLAARRRLVGALAWPMIQLGMAVLVVAILIWIPEAMNLTDLNGQPLDMLGFGLRGTSGLAVLVGVVLAAMLLVVFGIESARRGRAGTRAMLGFVSKLPVVGQPLQTLAIADFIWALQILLDTPMDLRKVLPLAFEATNNDQFSKAGPDAVRRISGGATIHEALRETGLFPNELLHAIEVGEESGMLAESLQRQAKEYQERAASALGMIAQFIGYAIWLLVAAVIIVLIFRLFGMYLDPIKQLTSPNFKV